MKKLLPLVYIIGGIAGLFACIGLVRGEQRTLRAEAVIRSDVKEVWESVKDVPNWGLWHPGIQRVLARAEKNKHPVYRTMGESGERDLELIFDEGEFRLDTVVTSESFEGSWKIELTAVPAGATVVITEKGAVKNPIIRGLDLFRDEHASMKQYIQALAMKHRTTVREEDIAVE